MSRDWYFIVGLAKTGTTAVTMTLLNTLKLARFLMEPQEPGTIEQSSAYQQMAIKVIFDHWQTRVDALTGLVRPTGGDQTPTTIVIVRDPRDEAISRLHYAAYNYFSTRPTTAGERAEWIAMFGRKEENPGDISIFAMENEIKDRSGGGVLAPKGLHDIYSRFIDAMTDGGPPTTYVLRYEDFVANTISNETLRRLLSASHDVGPLLRRVHRSGSSGAWRDFLTDADLAVMNARYGAFLRRFDYAFDRSRPPARLSAENGSEYVAKLIDECTLGKGVKPVPR